MFAKIFGDTFGAGLHACFTWFPPGGAHLSMTFMKLQRINHAQHFVYVAPERQVVDHFMAHNAAFVYEEGSPQGNVVRMSNPVRIHDFPPHVGYQRDAYRTYAALVYRRVPPRVVGKL